MDGEMSDTTPCYAAYCPVCNGMVAVTVAPVSEPVALRRAITYRGQWERAGLRIAIVTVADIHNGAMQGHAEGCANDKRKKARPR